jgi:hypothetical protein
MENKMFDVNLASACGVYCGECNYLGKECAGCNNLKGKPFWAAQFNMNICPLYDCAINKKQLEHCGFCNELPCKTFLEMKDPAMTDEQFNESVQKRCANLKKRKETGAY